MPESIKSRRRKALLAAGGSAVCQAAAAGLLLWIRSLPGIPVWVRVLLLVCALADLALLLPLVYALKQRLHEIQGGEEDEARQY